MFRPSYSVKTKYALDITSQHPQFLNRPIKKYGINGVDTIGVWSDEPFEIKFRNNTYSKVQVKISIDGTDILTGELATTENNGQMWLVDAFETLNLKAWAETKNGGASFVFTNCARSRSHK